MLSESVSICRYLEALHPTPALFGADDFARAWVDQWIRRVEMNIQLHVSQFWRHFHPLTAHLIEHALMIVRAESNRARVAGGMRWLEKELGKAGPFIAGDAFSMADIVTITTVDFARFIGLPIPEDCPSLLTWRGRMEERPSVRLPESAADRYRVK